MNITFPPRTLLRPLFTFLLLALPCFSAVGAEEVVPNGSSLKIEYRELIDDSVYGHSGLPASKVLQNLQTLPAGNTRKEIERQITERVLKERVAELQAALEDPSSVDGEATKKQEELAELSALLNDEKRLARLSAINAIVYRAQLDAYIQARPEHIQALIADLEPVCEPAAVVLNDALAQKDPATLNPNLVELSFFYPGGAPEPAWADLVRTRRFVVYTDGEGYCRLFLPGKDAASAWRDAYGVVRHVLRSQLNPNRSDATLAVDVYAYENDIPSTTLTLHLEKLTRRVAANDLGTPEGLRPLKLDDLAAFFAEGLTLEGCGVNADGDLVLIGSEGDSRPTLEGHPIELSDLAVAYRAAAYAGHGESYMSLDSAADPRRVNVNFGGRLHDTRLGWVAYRCDLRFKTLGDDLDAVTFENHGERIRDLMPDFMSQQGRQFSNPAGHLVATESTRFWFYPDDFGVVTLEDGISCLSGSPKLL